MDDTRQISIVASADVKINTVLSVMIRCFNCIFILLINFDMGLICFRHACPSPLGLKVRGSNPECQTKKYICLIIFRYHTQSENYYSIAFTKRTLNFTNFSNLQETGFIVIKIQQSSA